MKYLLCAIASLLTSCVHSSYVRFSPGSTNLLHSHILSHIDDEKLVDVQRYIGSPLSHVQTWTGQVHGHLRPVFSAGEAYEGCQGHRLKEYLFVAVCSSRLLVRRLEPAGVGRLFELDVKAKVLAVCVNKLHIAVLTDGAVRVFDTTFPVAPGAAIPVDARLHSNLLCDKSAVYLYGDKCSVHKYSLASKALAVVHVDRDRPCKLYAVGGRVFAAVDRDTEVQIVALDSLQMLHKVQGRKTHSFSREDGFFLGTEEDFCVHDKRQQVACRGASLGAVQAFHEFGGSLFGLRGGQLVVLLPGEPKPRLLDSRTDVLACVEFSCVFADGAVKKLDTIFVRVRSESLSLLAVDVDQRRYELRVSVSSYAPALNARVEVTLHRLGPQAPRDLRVPFDLDELPPADRVLQPSTYKARLYEHATEPLRYTSIYTIWSKEGFPALQNRHSAAQRLHGQGVLLRQLDGKLSYFSWRVFALPPGPHPHTMLLLDEHGLSPEFRVVDALQVRGHDLHLPVLLVASSLRESLLQLSEDTYVERYSRAKLDSVLARFDFVLRFGSFATCGKNASRAVFVGVGHSRTDTTEHMRLALFRLDRDRPQGLPLVLRPADCASLAYSHYDVHAYSALSLEAHSLVRFVYDASLLLQHLRLREDDVFEEVYHRSFDLATHRLLHLSPTHLYLKTAQALFVVWVADGRYDTTHRLPQDAVVDPCGSSLCLYSLADRHLAYLRHGHDRLSFEVFAVPYQLGEIYFEVVEDTLVFGLRNGTGEVMTSRPNGTADSILVRGFESSNSTVLFKNSRSSVQLDLLVEEAPTLVSAIKVNSNLSIEVFASNQLFNLSVHPAQDVTVLDLLDKPEPCPIEPGCLLVGFVVDLWITRCAADTFTYVHRNGSVHSTYTYKAAAVKAIALQLAGDVYAVHVTANQTYLALHNRSLALHEDREGQEHLIEAAEEGGVAVFACYRLAPQLNCDRFLYSAGKGLTASHLQETRLDRPAPVFAKLCRSENTLIYATASQGKQYLDLVYMSGNSTYVYTHPIGLAVPPASACSSSGGLLHCSFAAEASVHSLAFSPAGRSHKAFETAVPAGYAVLALEQQGPTAVATFGSRFNNYTVAFNASDFYHLPAAPGVRVLVQGARLYESSESRTTRRALRHHRYLAGLTSSSDLSKLYLEVSAMQAEAIDVLHRVPLAQVFKGASAPPRKSFLDLLVTWTLYLALFAMVASSVYFFLRLRGRRRRVRRAAAQDSLAQPPTAESSLNTLLPG